MPFFAPHVPMSEQITIRPLRGKIRDDHPHYTLDARGTVRRKKPKAISHKDWCRAQRTPPGNKRNKRREAWLR